MGVVTSRNECGLYKTVKMTLLRYMEADVVYAPSVSIRQQSRQHKVVKGSGSNICGLVSQGPAIYTPICRRGTKLTEAFSKKPLSVRNNRNLFWERPIDVGGQIPFFRD